MKFLDVNTVIWNNAVSQYAYCLCELTELVYEIKSKVGKKVDKNKHIHIHKCLYYKSV